MRARAAPRRSPGRRRASPARAPACRAAAAGAAPLVVRRRRGGLATRSLSSTTRSTASTPCPRIGGGNVPADRHLGHAERGEHARRGGSRTAPRRRRTPRPRRGRRARRRSARCVSGDRSRPLHPPQRPGGEHPGEVRAGGGGAAVGRDPLHPVRRAWRGSPAARPARARAPVVIGMARKPTRPMSWYSGSHDTITSSSARSRRPRTMRRGWRARTRSGIITPFGSLVEPLVYCRIDEPLGVVRRDLAVARRAGPLAAGQRSRPASTIGGSPGDRLVERRRAAASISTSLASPWRMRARVCRRTPRASPSASAAAAPCGAAPASQQPWMAVIERARRRAEDGHVVAGARARGPAARRATTRASSWSCAHETNGRPRRATEGPTKRTPVGRSAAAIEAVDDPHGRRSGSRTDIDLRTRSDGRRSWPVVAVSGPMTLEPRTIDRRPTMPRSYRYTARARAGDRDSLAGPVGRRGHVRGAQPGRAAGRPGEAIAGRPKLFVLDMFPYPSRRRACTSATRSASSAPTSTPATSA